MFFRLISESRDGSNVGSCSTLQSTSSATTTPARTSSAEVTLTFRKSLVSSKARRLRSLPKNLKIGVSLNCKLSNEITFFAQTAGQRLKTGSLKFKLVSNKHTFELKGVSYSFRKVFVFPFGALQ
jgi:hypothetical protein